MAVEKIIEAIDSRADRFILASDRIWEYAETAFVEYQSMNELCTILEAEGFAVERGIGGVETAFSGTYGSEGPVIGLLGEYDALFGLSQVACVKEKKSLQEGAPGHGCGHNLLGVGSLAAAIAVKEYLQETGLPGTVIYYGCPGEEGGSGKAFMAREGVFNNLDAAITWHPGDDNFVKRTGTLANIQAKFKFTGVSAHAAGDPYNGRSALDAVELMNVGIQFLREHMPPEARIHYAITNAGGLSPNVVQPYAEVLYLVRAPHNQSVKELYERVIKVAQGAALMTETDLEVEFVKACSNLVNNVVLERKLDESLHMIPLPQYTQEEIAFAEEICQTVPVEDHVYKDFAEGGDSVITYIQEHLQGPLMDFVIPYYPSNKVDSGSMDVGDVSWVCPTAQIYATTTCRNSPGHSWQNTSQGKTSYAHKGMLYAAKVMAITVAELMSDPDTLAAAKEELRRRIGPEGYVCPIPPGVIPQAIR